MTSVLVGASRPEQLENSAQALKSAVFTKEELDAIDAVLHERRKKWQKS